MSEAPERIIYGRTMPAIYISHDEVPAWEKDATRYIRADIYEQQQERIKGLEQRVEGLLHLMKMHAEIIEEYRQEIENE